MYSSWELSCEYIDIDYSMRGGSDEEEGHKDYQSTEVSFVPVLLQEPLRVGVQHLEGGFLHLNG